MKAIGAFFKFIFALIIIGIILIVGFFAYGNIVGFEKELSIDDFKEDVREEENEITKNHRVWKGTVTVDDETFTLTTTLIEDSSGIEEFEKWEIEWSEATPASVKTTLTEMLALHADDVPETDGCTFKSTAKFVGLSFENGFAVEYSNGTTLIFNKYGFLIQAIEDDEVVFAVEWTV